MKKLILCIISSIASSLYAASSSTPCVLCAEDRLSDIDIRRSAGVARALCSAPSDASEDELAEIAATTRILASPEQPATSLPHGIPRGSLAPTQSTRPSAHGRTVARSLLFRDLPAAPAPQTTPITHFTPTGPTTVTIDPEMAARIMALVEMHTHRGRAARRRILDQDNQNNN